MKSLKILIPLGISLVIVSISVSAFARDLGQRRGQMWSPTVEWTLQNEQFEGDPLDVVAWVNFEHEDGGEKRTTEMFFYGGDDWKFRFTGTRTGEWVFKTSSSYAGLDGHTGSVMIAPNPDPDALGFLTHVGNKFAVQVGNDAHLEGYLLAVYRDTSPPGWDHFRVGRWAMASICTDGQHLNS